jgi:Uma2 family endonuclease
MSRSSAEALSEVHYPESDGKPMGETGLHVKASFDIYGTLRECCFWDRPDIYVAADMFFYYEKGNPKAVKAPDVMVIRGVKSKEERRTFKLWVEKIVPCVIFEVTSKDTRRDDTIVKRKLYARLGVAEYFLIDPLGEYLNPPLQGFQLEGDRYVPIAPGAEGTLASLQLGMKLGAENGSIRFFNARTNQPIPWYFELKDLADNLINDLTEERKKADREQKKAAREAKKAKTERQKADAERQKTEALEAEVKRLRALLEGRGSDV